MSLTVGDIRPFLTLVTNLPIFNETDTIAGSLRSLLQSTGAPITPETDAALTIIEANPILIAVGFAEFQAAIAGLPDSTLLSEIPQFAGSGDPGTPTDPTPDPTPDPDGPTTDANGNQVQSFQLPFSGIQFQVSGNTVTVTGEGINQQLTGLDRITFSDGTYYLDATDAPGIVKTAYQGILGRPAPDGDGFAFWVNIVESAPLTDYFAMTEAFVQTDAFQTAYGDVLTDSAALVERIYQNLLGRAADDAGQAFWQGYIDANGVDVVDETFAYFLQSDEMQTLIGTTLSDGFFV